MQPAALVASNDTANIKLRLQICEKDLKAEEGRVRPRTSAVPSDTLVAYMIPFRFKVRDATIAIFLADCMI